MNNDHVHPIFQGILAAIAPASAASNNLPASIAPETPSEAFQEGQDAVLLGQSLNPYRRALRAVHAPVDRQALEALAQQWEDGYVSKAR